MKAFLRRYRAALAYASLIFLLSSIPTLKSPDIGISFEDKIYHAIEYAVMGFLLQRGSDAAGRRSAKRFLLVFAAGVFYAATDEIHQWFVPGRQCDFYDFLSDAAGVFAGQAIFSTGLMWKMSRKKNN
jgi:VanZ family protein